jgi:hypothetical protein
MTSSMPTSAATARAVVSLSPVRSTGRRPSACSARPPRPSGLDGVGDRRTPRAPRRPSGGHGGLRRAAPPPCGRRPARRAASCRARRAARAADHDARPSTMPSTPRPLAVAKPSTAERRSPAAAAIAGRADARRRPPARRRAGAPRRGRCRGTVTRPGSSGRS